MCPTEPDCLDIYATAPHVTLHSSIEAKFNLFGSPMDFALCKSPFVVKVQCVNASYHQIEKACNGSRKKLIASSE